MTNLGSPAAPSSTSPQGSPSVISIVQNISISTIFLFVVLLILHLLDAFLQDRFNGCIVPDDPTHRSLASARAFFKTSFAASTYGR